MWPTLLTAGNLLCGFAAIVMLTLPRVVGWGEPQLATAVWLIVLAGVLDGVDGPIARWGGREPTPWGREFDSLADLVSFGIAPVVLIGIAVPSMFQLPSAIFGALYVMAGAWRLARFIWAGSKVTHGRFEGLPITGAGLAVAAFWLFEKALWGSVAHPLAAFVLTGTCSLLMVSHIEFEKFPELGRHDRRNRVKWGIALGAIAIIAIDPARTGLPIAILYLGYGPVRALMHSSLAGIRNRHSTDGS